MTFEVPTLRESGMGKDVENFWEDTIIAFCFVIIQFQCIVGHPHFDIVDAFLHVLYKFTNMIFLTQIFLIATSSASEWWWIEWRSIILERGLVSSSSSCIPYPRGSLGHHRWFRNQFSRFFPVLHCPLGPAEPQACPFPNVVVPPLPLSALPSSPFHCALQDGFGRKVISDESH